MKIVHFSDSHLGYTAYRRLDAAGYNQRGEDICKAFIRTVDEILGLRPDLVLHAGDLFDAPRPLNRMVTLAYEQLLRFRQAGIPLIIISGNHETPKQKGVGNILALLNILKSKSPAEQSGPQLERELEPGEVYAVHQGRYERLLYRAICVHAVPHCLGQTELQQELTKITLDPQRRNIGLFHAGVSGLKEFREGDLNEQLLSYQYLTGTPFDHVALGHLHRQVQVAPRAWFAGSVERLSFNEAGQPKGFLEIELDPYRVTPHHLSVREMADLPAIDAAELNSEQLLGHMTELAEKAGISDKVVRLKIKNLRPEVYTSLDFQKIRAMAATALHFEAVYEKVPTTDAAVQEATIRGLTEEFLIYLQHAAEDQARIKARGLQLLQEALEKRCI